MKRRKEDYIVIIFAGVLLFIVFIIVILAFNAPNTSVQQQNAITPTPTPTLSPNETEPSPTDSEPHSNPPVQHDSEAELKFLDKIENRRPLSDNDAFAKAKIIALLPQGETSGTVYQSGNIRIAYIEPGDVFQIEILTTNIDQAKAEANIWLRSKGISQQGICDIPIQFYLNWDIMQELKGSHIIFSPLPNGC